MINVIGFPWCKHAPKRIGLANFTAKILCDKHNSILSPTDAEAKNAARVFIESAKLAKKRAKRPDRNSPVRSFQLSGPLLERWFLKTFINIACVRETAEVTWDSSGRIVTQLPDELVGAAFGLRPLAQPKGLYSAAAVEEEIFFSERIDFAALYNQFTGSLIGGVLTFFGQRFLIYFGSTPLAVRLELPGASATNWRRSLLSYRLQRLQTMVNERLSHYVDFVW